MPNSLSSAQEQELKQMRREALKVAFLNTLFILALIGLYLADRAYGFLDRLTGSL